MSLQQGCLRSLVSNYTFSSFRLRSYNASRAFPCEKVPDKQFPDYFAKKYLIYNLLDQNIENQPVNDNTAIYCHMIPLRILIWECFWFTANNMRVLFVGACITLIPLTKNNVFCVEDTIHIFSHERFYTNNMSFPSACALGILVIGLSFLVSALGTMVLQVNIFVSLYKSPNQNALFDCISQSSWKQLIYAWIITFTVLLGLVLRTSFLVIQRLHITERTR